MNCGSPGCAFPKCGCMAGIKSDSHKGRMAARQKLIAKLDQVAAKTGMTRRAASVSIGLNDGRLSQVISGEANCTLDTLVLYLARLGVKTRFYFVDENEEEQDDTGTFRA